MKKGIPVKQEVFDGRKVKYITAIVKKEKRIKTSFGKKDTLVIKPTFKDFRKEGLTKTLEKITLYLQKELPRVLYLVKGKLLIGSLKAKLIKINPS